MRRDEESKIDYYELQQNIYHIFVKGENGRYRMSWVVYLLARHAEGALAL